MMANNKYAILDFDSNQQAIIQPNKNDYNFTLSPNCIAIFFKDIVEELSKSIFVNEIGRVQWETGDLVYYRYKNNNTEFCFYHTWVGSSISAALLDLSIALGAKNIIACGGCGVLNGNIPEGHILIPICGVRDEGTSFHYSSPQLEISCQNEMLRKLISYLTKKSVPYHIVKTWTTDGFYRETEEIQKIRVKQGCQTVDMEFTALCAVSKFRNVNFAQLFYAGDVVEISSEYDERNWQEDKDTRKYLIDLIINFFGGYI